MKKLYLIIIIVLMLFTLKISFAGYDPDVIINQVPPPQIIVVQESNEKHWYLEMVIGGSTLLLGALGIWLKYRRKQ